MKKATLIGGVFLSFLGGARFFSVSAAWRDECRFGDVATIKGFECLVGNLLKGVFPVAGVAVGVMIIASGLKLLASGGEKDALEKAKAALTAAIFGFVLIFLSWFLLKFIEFFTGISVTQFVIGE